jgi:hypothetical protein
MVWLFVRLEGIVWQSWPSISYFHTWGQWCAGGGQSVFLKSCRLDIRALHGSASPRCAGWDVLCSGEQITPPPSRSLLKNATGPLLSSVLLTILIGVMLHQAIQMLACVSSPLTHDCTCNTVSQLHSILNNQNKYSTMINDCPWPDLVWYMYVNEGYQSCYHVRHYLNNILWQYISCIYYSVHFSDKGRNRECGCLPVDVTVASLAYLEECLSRNPEYRHFDPGWQEALQNV